jgi:hypothetical protein
MDAGVTSVLSREMTRNGASRSIVAAAMIALFSGCGDAVPSGPGAIVDAAPSSDAASGDDAGLGPGADGGGGDPSGLYLFSIQRPIGSPIRFLATIAYAPLVRGGSAMLSLQPLKVNGCPEEGSGGTIVGPPIAASDIAIEEDGSFETGFVAAIIGSANPERCFDLTVMLRFSGWMGGDTVCGAVSGTITLPPGQSFAGSTFGALKVQPGVIGDASLPDPVTSCSP